MFTFFRRLLSRLDTIFTWLERLERIPWWRPVGAVIMGTLYGIWAWATQLPPVIVTFIAIQVVTCMVLLFTFGPLLLRAFRRPSFSITIPTNQLSLFSTVVPFYVDNRGDTRLRLHLILVIPLSTGQDYQIPYAQTLAIEPRTDPTMTLVFIPKAPPFGPVMLFPDAYILVTNIDDLPKHSVQIKIPGSFPHE